ncbi:MAG TPA: hypothetical protein PLB10_16225 [Thiolinea sp.]|nr:hypothetical protein [Thiolinea sp.]
MKTKTLLLGSLVFPLVLLAGCSGPSVEDATQQFCQSLGDLEQALDKGAALTADSTVRETEAVQKEVQKAMEGLDKAGSQVQKARLDDVRKAAKALNDSIDSVKGKDTLAEAQAKIAPAIETFRTARQQVYQDVQCK